ncbi:bifunctional adenosylcobinamide kinase/adenosylcobinamide-phosphate guanylyltransferase [Shewanella salipaludis]|uniref:Bifunctional adenosylcobalamin biosynthesis protein n=1 Tax=Shewanella salipaludis TaxID=2723052 RepID=A0A972FYD4_9GAMM|nr:bifunctional adenosylcobinamide kinase/adenosylcobinamide-phosphate guanylyltransferase [Shewanella salipaludis]NMH64922.1 bifunctional adenosylcobinamide kinase/adenosylcobinamide-phosphate guanylyltransferase [Shewanella salipaludis]
MIHLVLGGARSGKSSYGESLVQALAREGHECLYLATATAGDGEMAARIARHRRQRQAGGLDWQLHEVPLALADALTALAAANRVILVDCLTLYLTNELLQCPADWPGHKARLLACLPGLPGDIILISNEVGSGIVPMGELSRQFVDEAGWLNQAMAQVADSVTLVVAGLPLPLKGGMA